MHAQRKFTVVSVVFFVACFVLFVGASPLRAQLVGLWQFEEGEGGVAGDSSLAGNDASLVGDASFVNDAERGNVMSLDGDDSWLSTGAFVAELGNADFTIAAWIKTATRGSTFIGKQNDNDTWQNAEKKFYVVGDDPFGSQSTPGAIVAVGHGVDWLSSTGPVVDDDQWHHVAITFQRNFVDANPGVIYVDGEEVPDYGKQAYNGNPDNATDTFYIGRTPGDDGTVNFNGLLDDVAVFDIALTPEQVEIVMDGDFGDFIDGDVPPEIAGAPANDSDRVRRGHVYSRALTITGCPAPTTIVVEPVGAEINEAGILTYDTNLEMPDSSSFTVSVTATNSVDMDNAFWEVSLEEEPPLIVGLWDFEEGGGPVAGDQSTIGNDAELVGGASFFNDAERGSVMSFDGTGWLSTGAFVAELGDADFSCAAWVKATTPGGVWVSKQNDDDLWENNEKKFYISGGFPNGNSPAGAIAAVGRNVAWISSTGPLVNDDQWHHIVVTFQRDRVGNSPGAIYVDGEEVPGYGKQDYNGNADNSSDTFYIGRTPGDDATVNFEGLLDDVTIFTAALDVCQVASVMDGDLSLSQPGVSPSISGAPDEDNAIRGDIYTAKLDVFAGCPFPNFTVQPEGATITPTGLLTYDTDLVVPGADSFDIEVKATNASGTATVSWTVIFIDPPTLRGLWRFNDVGDQATDESVLGNDGDLVGDAAFLNDPERGNVLSVGGSGWVDVGTSVLELGNADFSCAAWVKATTPGGVWVSKQNDNEIWENNEKKFYISGGFPNGNSPAGAVAAVGHNVAWISSTGPLVNDDQWHHIVVTFRRDRVDNSPGAIYVDGEEVPGYGKQDYNGNADNPSDTFYIGRTPGDDATVNFDGLLDDVAVFSTALDRCQVESVMNGDFSLNQQGIPPSISGAPDDDNAIRGDVYTAKIDILTGCPVPDFTVEPAGATITPTGFLTYDTNLEPGADSIDIEVEATNTSGSATVSWTVILLDPPELRGLWRFNDVGGRATDESVLGNDGDLVGDATFFNDPERGSVLSVGGSGWVDVGKPVGELGDSDFSCAAWVKTTTAGGVWVSKQSNDAAWQFSEKKFYISGGFPNGNSPAGAVAAVGHSVAWISSTGPLVDDGRWHHIVVTFQRDRVDNSPGTIYVDGEEVPEYGKQDYKGTADNPSDTFYIGRTPGDDATVNFDGLLDDVAIFNIALTPDQVATVMEDDFREFVEESEKPETSFRRGDCDQSGTVDFNDAIYHLRFLFLGENEKTVNSCKDACDSDDSGTDDFTDDINTLKVLFLGQGNIPAPGPLLDETHPCGTDPTVEEPEELTCHTYAPTTACP